MKKRRNISLSAEALQKLSEMAKKAIVTLNDGSKHVFNYGMLNIDKVVEAIKAK